MQTKPVPSVWNWAYIFQGAGMSAMDVHHLGPRSQAPKGREWQRAPFFCAPGQKHSLYGWFIGLTYRNCLYVYPNKRKINKKIKERSAGLRSFCVCSLQMERELEAIWSPYPVLQTLWCSPTHLELYPRHFERTFLYSTMPRREPHREAFHATGGAKEIVFVWPRG